MGTFKAHDGEYFLEPVMKADGSEREDDHNKPHLIYRQELKSSSSTQSHGPCDVSGKLQLKFQLNCNATLNFYWFSSTFLVDKMAYPNYYMWRVYTLWDGFC